MRRLKPWERRIKAEALKESREESREESASIRAMLKLELAGELATRSAHIDHSPGGSPSPYPPAAPAPDHTYRTPDTFRPRKVRTPDGRVSFHDLILRANRAASQAMRGEAWSDAQRQDAASHCVESVLRMATQRHGPQPDLPAELATGVGLYRLAKDARESMRASLDRDHAEHVRRAFTEGAVSPEPGAQLTDARDLDRSIHSALTRAWDACEALGVSTTGPTFTVAYTAARMTVVESLADVASELGMTPAAHRKVISRVPSSIPAASSPYIPRVKVAPRGSLKAHPASFLQALASLDHPDAGTTRAGAAGLEHADRQLAPSKVSTSRCRKRLRRTPATWVLALSPRARAAMHAASSARQDRADIPPTKQAKP